MGSGSLLKSLVIIQWCMLSVCLLLFLSGEGFYYCGESELRSSIMSLN